MKKKLAFLLAAVMVFSLIAVPVSANPAGTLPGTGETLVPDPVILVTLPTLPANADNWNFILDPGGLLTAGDPGQNPGIIFGGEAGFRPTFINRSSVDILLGVELLATTGTDAAEVAFVNTAGAVLGNDVTAKNVFIGVQSAGSNVNAVPANNAWAGGTPSAAIAVTNASAQPVLLRYVFPAANYNPVQRGANWVLELDDADPDFQGTQIQFTGALNAGGTYSPDWSGDEEVNIGIRFSFDTDTTTSGGTAVPAAPGVADAAHLRDSLANTNVWNQTVEQSSTYPVIARTGLTVIPFDWAGQPAAGRLGTVTIGGTTVTAVADHTHRPDGVIHITAGVPASVTAGEHPMVINVTNGNPARTTITVRVP